MADVNASRSRYTCQYVTVKVTVPPLVQVHHSPQTNSSLPAPLLSEDPVTADGRVLPLCKIVNVLNSIPQVDCAGHSDSERGSFRFVTFVQSSLSPLRNALLHLDFHFPAMISCVFCSGDSQCRYATIACRWTTVPIGPRAFTEPFGQHHLVTGYRKSAWEIPTPRCL